MSVLQFSEYMSFTSLVKFTPRYFILFYEILKRTAFLLSPSDNYKCIEKQQISTY